MSDCRYWCYSSCWVLTWMECEELICFCVCVCVCMWLCVYNWQATDRTRWQVSAATTHPQGGCLLTQNRARDPGTLAISEAIIIVIVTVIIITIVIFNPGVNPGVKVRPAYNRKCSSNVTGNSSLEGSDLWIMKNNSVISSAFNL